MTFAFQYLKEHLRIVRLQAAFVCIFAAAFYLYRLPLGAVVYPALLCTLLGSFAAGRALYEAYQKHRRMTAMASLHRNTLQEAFEENARTEERDYQRIIGKLCRDMQELEDETAASYKEMLDYFTVWVHQIKTPIASIRLHLEAEDSRLSRRLKSDILHIEQYVEMVLTYLKMGPESTDYVFCTVDLDKILRETIRKLRGDFIIKKLNLIYEPVNAEAVSDEKWLSFVVEQILSNSLKYTNAGSVEIFLEEPKTLCIRDTGIGIAPEDLPRIFEKGYTGSNGRENKRASGLGLYLCRQVCERLGHKISVESQMEAGTTVRLNLSQYRQNV